MSDILSEATSSIVSGSIEAPAPTLISDYNEAISPEKLLGFMEMWKLKVEKEIQEYEDEKQKIYAVYKKQKDMYDGWLSVRLKKMKKYDVALNGRKKVLIDVNKEIAKLKSTPEDNNAQ